jgi:two-component system response regulator FixJ
MGAVMRAVYLVDGDAALRASLHGLLSATSDFAIHHFASADSFLAGKDALDPGVLVLDHDVPGANGLDVLERIERDPRFATVLLSYRSDIALVVQAMKAGAHDFLLKPCDSAQMADAVRAAADALAAAWAKAARIESARARIASLSPRERDVLAGLMEGHANKAIARQLGISPRTVEIYRAKLMEKCEVGSLAEALHVAFLAGMVPDPGR